MKLEQCTLHLLGVELKHKILTLHYTSLLITNYILFRGFLCVAISNFLKFLPNMPAKVIFISNTHPMTSFLGAKNIVISRVARKIRFSDCITFSSQREECIAFRSHK